MNPKKQKEKDRRRARKLAEEAWEAANANNLDLAEKIIRRAVAAQEDNPVFWNDQGMLLSLRHKEAEAAEAYRTAISLAPTFAEPYVRLAALRARQGFAKVAVALQAQAVRHAPENAAYTDQLDAYRSLMDQAGVRPASPPGSAESKTTVTNSESMQSADVSSGDWLGRIATYDWHEFQERLMRNGCVTLAGLLDGSTCEGLRLMYGDEALFAKTVAMDRPDYGLGTDKYFKAPIPAVVDLLRRGIYPHVARIANSWQRLLGEPDRYPPDWEAFREECARAGQATSTPILLKYSPGGFNAPHRDLRGAIYFPIQLAVVLSARAAQPDAPGNGFVGGDFLLCDVPEGKKAQRTQVAAGLGDAILFCTRDRLVPVGGVYGLQPVMHGVSTIQAGERYVLGVPFHEYR